MFILPLTHPLWLRLDDAHRTHDIAEMVQSLADTWEPEMAEALLWDHLCHQDTCYGATYAALPHLLTLARECDDPAARRELTEFLAHVSVVAVEPAVCGDQPLPQGLPTTIEGWTRKLDVYRDLQGYQIKTINDERQPQDIREYAQQRLSEISDVLKRPPIDADDLRLIEKIRETFFDLQGEIADLCARECPDVPADLRSHMLKSMAAGWGDPDLAALLGQGREGWFACDICQTRYSYQMFGDQMAYYRAPVANEHNDIVIIGQDPAMLDFRDGAPKRATGIVAPWQSGPRSTAATRIQDVLDTLRDTENSQLLDLVCGTIECVQCGETSGFKKV